MIRLLKCNYFYQLNENLILIVFLTFFFVIINIKGIIMTKHFISIEETLAFASEAHKNHLIKPSREKIPYHWHLLRVMLRLGDDATHEEKQVALLHDVLEDTTITKEDLKAKGFSDKVISDVVFCSYTEFPEMSKQQWMKHIHNNAPTSVVRVKYADISDNLGFERMASFYNILLNEMKEKNQTESSRAKSFERQTRGYPILARILTQIVGKTPYSEEPSVFPVYYDSLNYLLQGEKGNRENEVQNILSLEFSDRKLINHLLAFLPQEEKIAYLEDQKLNTWTIPGQISKITDNSGSDYIAVKVNNEDAYEYQEMLHQLGLHEYTSNQIKRDKGHFHVTIINAMEYGNLKKNYSEKLPILETYLQEPVDMFFHGIGKASKDDKSGQTNTALFAVIENATLSSLREKLGMKPFNFHMTLGFKDKDVHGVPKDKSTVIFSPQEFHYVMFDKNNTLTKKFKP